MVPQCDSLSDRLGMGKTDCSILPNLSPILSAPNYKGMRSFGGTFDLLPGARAMHAYRHSH